MARKFVKTPGKPEAILLDGLDCVIDGRTAKVTVTVRPSKASVLVFKQVRVLVINGSAPAHEKKNVLIRIYFEVPSDGQGLGALNSRTLQVLLSGVGSSRVFLQ